jgi:translation initiation factor 2 subunit 1
MINKEFRFYEEKYPQKDDLVIGQIVEVTEHHARVELHEYGKIDGFIVFTEFTRTRRGDIQKKIMQLKKIRKLEIYVVTQVDLNNGYIDLSKKRIGANSDMKEIEEKFEKGKKVNSFMYGLALETGKTMEWLYESIVWKIQSKSTHAHDILKQALLNFDAVFGPLNLEKDFLEQLKLQLEKKYPLQQQKIRATFNLTCYSQEGVEDIKRALREGETLMTKENDLKISLISSPLFMVNLVTFDGKTGLGTMKKCLELIQNKLFELTKDAKFEIKDQAKILGEKDEKEFNNMLNDIKRDRECEGDDDDDEFIEDMGNVDLES